jgi:hypothetical protein
MAALLAVCIKEEQRAVIRFLWSEGVSGAKIHRRLSTQCRDNALPCRSVYEWLEKFKSGRRVTHEEGAGQPSTSTTDEKTQQAREMVLGNWQVIIDEEVRSLQIRHGSAYHNDLGSHKVCARWVPRNLTAEHKCKCVEICQCLLDCYNNEAKNFLSRIITGDGTWVYHYEQNPKARAWRGNTRDRQQSRRLNLPRESLC